MFNGFTRLRKEKLDEMSKRAAARMMQQRENSRKQREKLIKQHHKTLAKRLASMSTDPVIRRDVSAQSNPLKKESRGFRFAARDSRERVEESQKQHSWLETVPINRYLSAPRDRDKSKEIQKDLRFTPRDRFNRLREAWKSQHNVVESSWKVQPSKANLFPSKNPPSYYKTLETLALNSSASLRPVYHKAIISLGDLNHETEIEFAKELTHKCGLRTMKINS